MKTTTSSSTKLYKEFFMAVVSLSKTPNISDACVPTLSSIAKNVIEQEASALYQMALDLGKDFEDVVHAILKVKGRIVLCGMGKSGHVAKKIAATLSSTGQPSFFVHPAEAAHGDLGMVTSEDLLILLSNQGESKELHVLIDYAKRFSIPLVGMTSNKNSTLARLSSYVLKLPVVEEACPMGLAPTTSTTMMMALGDALAITLLTHKGFTNSDFKKFHPGGKLGQQLKHVYDYMHKENLPLVTNKTCLEDALEVITEKGFGCVGIIDEPGVLTGIITDGDLRRHALISLKDKSVEDLMTKDPVYISAQTLMAEALSILQNKKITSLFVLDEREKPVGLIHIHDFLSQGVI
ncbi:MAG TPA: KpsF/GutQ family sugar-phosphate isomerase [Alphaproteobacteria bacterium]|nr:KpsF/GutQ family sugar-phosphate isomerase [Alphaproteobacteria bacterium]